MPKAALLPQRPLSKERFDAKVLFELTTRRYEIKTITSFPQLSEVLSFRKDVIDTTFAEGAEHDFKKGEWDVFDFLADHLVVVDVASRKIVGSYRLLCSEQTQSFTSQSEFMISGLLAQDGIKVELSRACVHPEFRNGEVIHLLWRGIAAYLMHTNARYLFGCASLPGMDAKTASAVYKCLKKHEKVREDLSIMALPPCLKPSELDPTAPDLELHELPPLLRAYLKAGAKVGGTPAFDPRFQCTDLFTVLETTDLAKTHLKRYLATPPNPDPMKG